MSSRLRSPSQFRSTPFAAPLAMMTESGPVLVDFEDAGISQFWLFAPAYMESVGFNVAGVGVIDYATPSELLPGVEVVRPSSSRTPGAIRLSREGGQILFSCRTIMVDLTAGAPAHPLGLVGTISIPRRDTGTYFPRTEDSGDSVFPIILRARDYVGDMVVVNGPVTFVVVGFWETADSSPSS
jgi:hypothetical protein